ncbi:hypothetical protein Vafri_688, partial [Volvox africanus]
AALIPYGSAGGADPTAAMQQLYAAQQLQQLQQLHQAQAQYLLQQQLQQQLHGSGGIGGGAVTSPLGPYVQGPLPGISAPAVPGLGFPTNAFAATAAPPLPQQQQQQFEEQQPQQQPQAVPLDSSSWGPNNVTGETQSILPLATTTGGSGGGGAAGMNGLPYPYGLQGTASPWTLAAQPPLLRLPSLQPPPQAIEGTGAAHLTYKSDLSLPALHVRQQTSQQPQREKGRGEVAAADTAQQAGPLLVQDPRSQGCMGGERISGGGGGSVADGAVRELPMPLQTGLFGAADIRGQSLGHQELGGTATGVISSSVSDCGVSDCGAAVIGQPPESLSSGFLEFQLPQMSQLINQLPH